MNKQLSEKKIVILDGTRDEDQHLDFMLTLLQDAVHKYYGRQTETFRLRKIKLNPCIGCFSCWLKNPGKCIHRDAGSDIIRAILTSNTVIFFTPVVFGGYSSELKKIVDRLLPTVLPFFTEIYGETHHQSRYLPAPRLIGVGVQPYPQKREAECFKILVGRNAINFNAPNYAVGTVAGTDSPETLRSRFQSLFSKSDNIPLRNDIYSLLNEETSLPKNSTEEHRALLIIGSQKTRHPSTSALLGEYLLKRLEKHGWKANSLVLGKNLCDKKGRNNLLLSLSRAETILLSFPLYVDTLPFLVTKALEVMALHWETAESDRPKRIFVLVNSGLPESYQNIISFAICQNFALKTGIAWAGGLAIGAGEALISGKPLTGFTGFRGLIKRPPLFYVKHSLKAVANALAKGEPIPEHAVWLLDKKPLPLISSSTWHYLFIKAANRVLKKEAIRNGLKVDEMFKTPYTD